VNMLAHKASSSIPASAVSSIIIPVRNAEPYLNDCIQSILDQTIRPLQICAHDDGSSDGSLLLLLQWQRRISEEQAEVSMIVTSGSTCRGVGGARNAAIASSTAEWLCFLDADDIMRPNRIALQVRLPFSPVASLFLTSHDADAAAGAAPPWPRSPHHYNGRKFLAPSHRRHAAIFVLPSISSIR
jgi:glycosyltransferase involved in cell wall biosynthesis